MIHRTISAGDLELTTLDQPERMLPEDLNYLPWNRGVNLRWQHFREILSVRWQEPGEPGVARGHWLFAGILDETARRPILDSKQKIGDCCLTGSAIVTVEGEWQDYHTFALVEEPCAAEPHPTLNRLHIPDTHRPSSLLRHTRILNALSMREYGQPLYFGANMTDEQRDLIDPLVQSGEVEFVFDDETYYSHHRFAVPVEQAALSA